MHTYKKLLTGVVVLAFAGIAHAGPLDPVVIGKHCDLWLEQDHQQIHVVMDCFDNDGSPIHNDLGYLHVDGKKDKSCKSTLNAVEKTDRNVYLVHTTCGNQTPTLVFELTGDDDTLLITNPENY